MKDLKKIDVASTHFGVLNAGFGVVRSGETGRTNVGVMAACSSTIHLNQKNRLFLNSLNSGAARQQPAEFRAFSSK